jgi:phage gp36-like protein
VAYSSQDDVVIAAGGSRALAELTDLDGALNGEIDPAVLAAAIGDADAMIDTYVGRNKQVPLQAPIPQIIKRLSADEALYLLRMRRQMVGEAEQLRHENNLRWLEGVARGFLTLGVDPQPSKSSLVAPAVVEVGEDDREITAESLKGVW